MEVIQKNVSALIIKKVSEFGVYLATKNEEEFTLEELNGHLQQYVTELAEQFKSSKKTKKGKKSATSDDEEKPKRAPSAYIVFCGALRPLIKEQFPTLKTTEVTKLMGAAWRKKEGKDAKDGDEDFDEKLDLLDIDSIEVVKAPKKEVKEPKKEAKATKATKAKVVEKTDSESESDSDKEEEKPILANPPLAKEEGKNKKDKKDKKKVDKKDEKKVDKKNKKVIDIEEDEEEPVPLLRKKIVDSDNEDSGNESE
jgi:hypothetical protein